MTDLNKNSVQKTHKKTSLERQPSVDNSIDSSSPEKIQLNQNETLNRWHHSMPKIVTSSSAPVTINANASQITSDMSNSNHQAIIVHTKPISDSGQSNYGASQLQTHSGSLEQLSALSGLMPMSNVGRKRKHPQKPGKHICKYCGRACAKPSVLEKHIRMHTGERPYPCDICSLSFKTKSNLYKHRKSYAHTSKLKEKGLSLESTHDESFNRDESLDAVDSDNFTDEADDQSTNANLSRSGSFGSINSLEVPTKTLKRDSSSTTDPFSSSIPVKDRELYIEALRQLEAADDYIDRYAVDFGFTLKRCEYSVVQKNVVVSVQILHSSPAELNPSSGHKSKALHTLIPPAVKASNSFETLRSSQSRSLEIKDNKELAAHVDKIVQENTEIIGQTVTETPRRRLSRQNSVSSPASSMFLSSQNSQSLINGAKLPSLAEEKCKPHISNGDQLEKSLTQVIKSALPLSAEGHESFIQVIKAKVEEKCIEVSFKLPTVPEFLLNSPRASSGSTTLPIYLPGQARTGSTCQSCHSIFSKEYTQDIHLKFYCPQQEKPKVECRKTGVETPLKHLHTKAIGHSFDDSPLSDDRNRSKLHIIKTGSEDTYYIAEPDEPNPKKLARSKSDMPPHSDEKLRSFISQQSIESVQADNVTPKQHLKNHLMNKLDSSQSTDSEPKPIAVPSLKDETTPKLEKHPISLAVTATTCGNLVETSKGQVGSNLTTTNASSSNQPVVSLLPQSSSSNQNQLRLPIHPSQQTQAKQLTSIHTTSTNSIIILPTNGKSVQPLSGKLMADGKQFGSVTEITNTPIQTLLQKPEMIKSTNKSMLVKQPITITTSFETSMDSTDGKQKSTDQSTLNIPKTLATRVTTIVRLPVASKVEKKPDSQAAATSSQAVAVVEPHPANKHFSSTGTPAWYSIQVPISSELNLSSISSQGHFVDNLMNARVNTSAAYPNSCSSFRTNYSVSTHHPITFNLLTSESQSRETILAKPRLPGQEGFTFECKSIYCTLNTVKPTQIVTAPRFSNYAMWFSPRDPNHQVEVDFSVSMSSYNSSWRSYGNVYKTSQISNRSILTHSSYWKYKNKIRLMHDMPSLQPVGEPITQPSFPKEQILTGDANLDSQKILIQGISPKAPLKPLVSPPNNHADVQPLTNNTRPSVIASDKKLLQRSQSTPTGDGKNKVIAGGFKSDEDYVYVRGRGKGQYVCKQCGIRCRKPSMLKKHIRTHTDLRPYSCKHCKFSFKTKGNLTKHMRSKAHHRRCHELKIFPVPSTVDDSQIDLEILASQQKLSRESAIKGLGDDAEDDDEDEEEDDEDDDDENDDDCMDDNDNDQGMEDEIYHDGDAAANSSDNESYDAGALQIVENGDEGEKNGSPKLIEDHMESAAAFRRAQSMPAHHMANSFDADHLDALQAPPMEVQPPPKKRKRNYMDLTLTAPTASTRPSQIEDDVARSLLCLSETPVNAKPAALPVLPRFEAATVDKIDHLIGAHQLMELTLGKGIMPDVTRMADAQRVSVVRSTKISHMSMESQSNDDNNEPIDLRVAPKSKPQELKFLCPLCRAICNNQSSLDEHMKKHETPEEVTADNISFKVKWKKSHSSSLSFEALDSNQTQKVQTPTTLKRQKAIFMSNESESEEDLDFKEDGEKANEETKKRKCPYCCKILRSTAQLPLHIKKYHMMAQEYVCTYKDCGSKFTSTQELTFHLGNHALVDNKEFQPITIPKCGVCDKTFKSISSLKQHVQQHTEIRSHICEYCDAGFTTAQSLKHHLNTHTQERPYICGECGSTFARSDHLQQHSKMHKKTHKESTNEPLILSPSGNPPKEPK